MGETEEPRDLIGPEALKRLKGSPYDPIRLLAMYALGDVVGLGLMTVDELEDGELLGEDGETIKQDGRTRALTLIPPKMRMDAVRELAKYLYPQHKPYGQLDNPNGAGEGGVQVHLPDNGRGGDTAYPALPESDE